MYACMHVCMYVNVMFRFYFNIINDDVGLTMIYFEFITVYSVLLVS